MRRGTTVSCVEGRAPLMGNLFGEFASCYTTRAAIHNPDS
jgi:hypothetical protein